MSETDCSDPRLRVHWALRTVSQRAKIKRSILAAITDPAVAQRILVCMGPPASGTRTRETARAPHRALVGRARSGLRSDTAERLGNRHLARPGRLPGEAASAAPPVRAQLRVRSGARARSRVSTASEPGDLYGLTVC